jgi:hypothetical protein
MTVEQSRAAALQVHASGRIDEAERLYRQILQTFIDDPDTQHALAILLMQSGREVEGIAAVRCVLQHVPAFTASATWKNPPPSTITLSNFAPPTPSPTATWVTF